MAGSVDGFSFGGGRLALPELEPVYHHQLVHGRSGIFASKVGERRAILRGVFFFFSLLLLQDRQI
jgi:hypothetical protein